MKRKIFFWLEKLNITPQERITVAGLMILLVALSLANYLVRPGTAADPERYHAILEEFERRTALLEKREEQRMQRYDPPVAEPLPVAQSTPAYTNESALQSDTSKTGTDTTASSKRTKININKAGIEKLESLPGIGPVYAKRIVTYRQEKGGFSTVSELKKIRGIGPKTLEKLRPLVEVR